MDRVRVKLGDRIEDVEIRMIKYTLKSFNGNKTRTALSLGIALRTLANKMKKHGIKREDYIG